MSFSKEATFRVLDDSTLELLEWDRTKAVYVETGRKFAIVGEQPESIKVFSKLLGKTVYLSEQIPAGEVEISFLVQENQDLLKTVREPVLDRPAPELPAVAPENNKVTIAAGVITAEKISVGTIQAAIPEGGTPKLLGEETTKPKKERKQKQEKTGEAK